MSPVSSVVASVIVRSQRVVFPDGVRPATIHIENGRIARIGAYEDAGLWSALAGPKLGQSGLELSLAAVWSCDGARRLQPSDVARWMSEAPARLAGLENRKGRIALGYDADPIVWDPDAEWAVDPSRLQQRHKLSPYAGRRLRGRVQTTFVRGTRAWDEGRLVAAGRGQFL